MSASPPQLRVIIGGRQSGKTAELEAAKEIARALARGDIDAMLARTMPDSQTPLFIFAASYEEEKMDRAS